MPRLTDYIIDHAAVDWAHVLTPWAWLLPPALTVWMMNRFGDLLVVFEDGSVHMLDVGGGSLTRLADNRDHFGTRLDEDNNANEWLMIPLVDALVASGMTLQPGECYSYRLLPVLGGDYTQANVKVLPIPSHYAALGPIHEKIKDLPDGTRVKFAVAGEQVDAADDHRAGTENRDARS